MNTEFSERIIEGIIAPFGQTIYHPQYGLERYRPGVFAGTDFAGAPVTLVDEDHKTTVGVLEHIEERPEGVHGRFRVAKTQRGDEILELSGMGALWGFSAGHDARDKHPEGNVTVHTGARLMHVAVLSTPAYTQAKVTSVRSDMTGIQQPQPAQQPQVQQPAPAQQPHYVQPQPAQQPQYQQPPAQYQQPAQPAQQPAAQRTNEQPTQWASAEDVTALRTELEQAQRAVVAAQHTAQQAVTPAPELHNLTVIRTAGEYMHHAALAMDGNDQSLELLKRASDEVPALRAAAESGATENFAGAVPEVYMGPFIDLIRAGAPTVAAMERFGLTTQLTPTGMMIHRPKMSQGSITAWEAAEGDEPANQRATSIDVTAAVKTLKTRTRLTLAAAMRSSPSALNAVLRDQTAAIATDFNAGVVNGAGNVNQSTGALAGLLNMTGIQAVTIATWDRDALQDAVAEAEEAVSEATNQAPLFWIMRTRRRSRIRALRDADGRPLNMITSTGQAVNVIGNAPTPGNGSRLGGPGQNGADLNDYPIIGDNTVPNDLGAGADEDVMILVGAGCAELHHASANSASLMLPDDFQTTYGMYKMGAQIPTVPQALAVIAGPGLAVS